MDPLRTAAIWMGVGAGHVAVLVAAWGVPGPSVPAEGEPLTLLLVSSEPAPSLAASVARAEPVDIGSVPQAVPAAVSPAPRAASSARAPEPVVSAPAPVVGVAGEPPGFVDRVEPLYPRGARLAGVEGVVRLRLRVGADGRLRRVDLLAGSGDGALDRAAVAAATASTYRPARVGGRAVESEVESTYRFELR